MYDADHQGGSSSPIGVYWAWQARGSARAQYTSQDAFREFHRRLKVAENCLDDVVARDPDDVTAWTYLVTSARARQVGPDEARRRFAEVVNRHPLHIVAHEQMLQFVCRKWSGSHDEMFAFAREAAAAAPPGHLLPEVLVVAHLEMWLDLPVGEDAEYMSRPDVAADIIGATEQSILHPDYRHRLGWVPRVNTFAMGLSVIGEHALAARAFDLIGDRVSEWPWQYWSRDPVATFTEQRAKAYRNGPDIGRFGVMADLPAVGVPVGGRHRRGDARRRAGGPGRRGQAVRRR